MTACSHQGDCFASTEAQLCAEPVKEETAEESGEDQSDDSDEEADTQEASGEQEDDDSSEESDDDDDESAQEESLLEADSADKSASDISTQDEVVLPRKRQKVAEASSPSR